MLIIPRKIHNKGTSAARWLRVLAWCCLVLVSLLAYQQFVASRRPCNASPTAKENLGSALLEGSLNVSALQHLVSRIGTLGSARILDSAVANGFSHQQMRQLVQWHQALYCSSNIPLQLPDTKVVAISQNWSMHVRVDHDYVSQNIQNNKNWDPKGVDAMKWALQQLKSEKQKQAAAKIKAAAAAANTVAAGKRALYQDSQQQQTSMETPFVVDIGAGCGYYGLAAAAAGARVAMFEAMPLNVKLLRHTLCANSWMANNIALYGVGLGNRSTTCHMISEDLNSGNGITVCDPDINTGLAAVSAAFQGRVKFLPRDDVDLRLLDAYVSEDVQAMKLDVEGYELPVVLGAEALLSGRNGALVWYIQANFNRELMSDSDQWKYVRFLDKWYAISESGFQGPFYAPDAIKQGTQKFGSVHPDLYLVRKELLA